MDEIISLEKDKKLYAINTFVTELKDQLSDKIWGIYLFGSVAKKNDTPESDIDLLVVYSDIDEFHLLEMASEISFRIACENGQLIETIPMSKEDFKQSIGHSPFLWEVLKFGTPIFTKLSGTEL